jgi:CDP-glycerol glycerophosphotransferase (TagB/SpsB family)
VLYAPTWEGNFDNVDYSSVAGMGVQLVNALLEDHNLRVLFKPHPATGPRLAAAGEALRRIEALLLAAPNGELVGTEPGSLYTAFNDCDVLIADVSSVVADFLASRKPYLMTNPKSRPHDWLEQELPSTTGATIIDCQEAVHVLPLLREALGPDARRERRESLANYFLGTPDSDPVSRFINEVGRCVGRAQARHDVAEPIHGEQAQA